MSAQEDAKQALQAKITQLAKSASGAENVLKLAEAWAWTASPAQAHGGHTKSS